MKNLILGLVTFTLSSPVFASENGFNCRNHMYRDAEFSFDSSSVSVQDSYVAGMHLVEAALERQMGLSGKLSIHAVKLTVSHTAGVQCYSSNTFLVNCEGSTKRAFLLVNGWIHSEGIGGIVNLSLPVELEDLRLKSSLVGNGPISLGGEPVAVPLDRANLKADARVILGGEEVSLSWDTFFYTRDTNNASYCKKF